MLRSRLRGPSPSLFALVFCLLAVVAAKRGGGGDIDSGSGSGSSGSGGGSSGDDEDLGPQHRTFYGPQWPYRFSGSYYNGTVTVQASILRWPNCNKGSEGPIAHSFDGILNVGSADDEIAFDTTAPRFTLVAWDAGKEPSQNWTDPQSFDASGLGGFVYFSPDVKVMFSRYHRSWQPYGIPSLDTFDLNWAVDSLPGDGNGTFRMNGTSLLNALSTYEIRENTNDNWLNITAPSCNGSADAFMMQLIQNSESINPSWGISDQLHNGTMQGMFSDTEAVFYWTGSFIGGFRDTDWGRLGSMVNSNPIGNFNVTFRGTIDAAQSDALSQRAAPASGITTTPNVPEWDVTVDRSKNVPGQTIWYGSASHFHLSTGALWMAPVLICILHLSL